MMSGNSSSDEKAVKLANRVYIGISGRHSKTCDFKRFAENINAIGSVSLASSQARFSQPSFFFRSLASSQARFSQPSFFTEGDATAE